MAILTIHCGAHKTATKSIQALLADGRRKLNKHGINYIHPWTINKAISWADFYSASDTQSGVHLHEVFEKSLKKDRGLQYIRKPDRVVVSHESFFSGVGLRPGAAEFYPSLETTIGKCNTHGIFELFERVELVFIVRRQDRFILSLYLYHLVTGLWAETFDTMVQRLDLTIVNWWRLAARMSAAPGVTKVHIRPFEKLIECGPEAFSQDVFLRLLGADAPYLGKLGRHNEGLSQPAYTLAMHAYPHLEREARRILGQSMRLVLPASRFGKPELLSEGVKEEIIRVNCQDNERLFDVYMPDCEAIRQFYLHDRPLKDVSSQMSEGVSNAANSR